ncbi:hypothetical protein [Ramlibacter rhizophilus]|uniref:Uncharacterized protein n=1 Tax=Ramlibacter rhizophilus TaxID=1781167 RepID=A0A4Z0BK26_9BURK|nr:hypothetical protein [Ramlibacter rhizophilus]TFY98464.1 hypothetical protein EZ242_13035 [Ramlibacter rhizophilus]
MRQLPWMLAVLLAACDAPEAERVRGGGPGGDVGNRPEVVQLHAGSRPYYDIEREAKGGMQVLEPANHARGFVRP